MIQIIKQFEHTRMASTEVYWLNVSFINDDGQILFKSQFEQLDSEELDSNQMKDEINSHINHSIRSLLNKYCLQLEENNKFYFMDGSEFIYEKPE